MHASMHGKLYGSAEDNTKDVIGVALHDRVILERVLRHHDGTCEDSDMWLDVPLSIANRT